MQVIYHLMNKQNILKHSESDISENMVKIFDNIHTTQLGWPIFSN